jgi:hypothetical protein
MRTVKIILITAFALFVVIGSPVLSQRTSVGREFPVYDNGGHPDLTIDPKRFASQMEIIDRLLKRTPARFKKVQFEAPVTVEYCASIRL